MSHPGRIVGFDPSVHPVLDGDELVRGDRSVVGEVETQSLRGNQRAFLHGLRAQHFAQGRVKEMGTRVVPHRRCAGFGVDQKFDRLAAAQTAPGELAPVHDQPFDGFARVFDLEPTAGIFGNPSIPHLPAAFGVEGGGPHDQFDLLAFNRAVDGVPVAEEYGDLRAGLEVFVADEFRLEIRSDPSVDFSDLGVAAPLPRLPGARSLDFHLSREARFVGGHLVTDQDVLGEVDRKAVGVVELEDDLAGKLVGSAILGGGDLALEEGETVGQGLEKTLLLAPHPLGDVVATIDQLGVSPTHLVDHRPGDLVQEGLFHPE